MGGLALVVNLFARRHHPRMPKQFLRRDTQVAVFLEAVIQEVLHYGRCTIWYGWIVILDNPEECRHGIEVVIGRISLQKLDDCGSY